MKLVGAQTKIDPERTKWVADWLGDWGGKLSVGFGCFLVVHLLYLAIWSGESPEHALISNLITIVIYGGPCLLALRISRHRALSNRTKRAWLLVSLANLSFVIGNILWIYYENYLGESPFPSWADAGYLAFYPLMFAGLLLLVDKFRSGEERLNYYLDTGVVLIGSTMVVWYFLIRPMSAASDGDTLKTILTIGYPVGDLVLLLGIAYVLLRRRTAMSRWPVNLILFGSAINFVADFVFSYQTIHGTYVSGSLGDSLFTLACFPVMLGAHVQWIIASREETATSKITLSAARNFWIPYVSVGVVYSVVLAVVFETPGGVIDTVMAFAGLVTALVIVRQFMFVRENTKANRALNELQDRIQGIYSASTDAIGLADFNGTLNEVNDSFVRLTGFHREEIVGVMKYQHFLPDDSSVDRSTPPDAPRSEIEQVLLRRDGTRRSVTTTVYPVNDASGNPAAMAVVIRDITDRRLLEDQLTHQAMHDALTGLANRALLHNRVASAISRGKRRKTQVSLLFLDLDNFKTVNDTLGHAAGDLLLCTVAERLRRSLRLSDTPARLGGDEFAVLLEDIEDPSEETRIAARLLEEVQRPIEIQGKEVFVGASIGIAQHRSFDSSDDLVRNADVAMYTAKRNGKNCFAVFEDEMHEAVLKRARIEDEIRTGIANGEFRLKFQPIVDLCSNEVVGIEALLRWDHPSGIPIGPDEFIPIAEEANLITALGRFVIYEACAHAGRWNRTIARDSRLAVSVNISSKQFQDDGFFDMVTDACSKGGIMPSDLILEITESTMLHNAEETVTRLEEIKCLGIRLAVDDFGTGYSSLSYLHKYPISVLKIDRSFVENLGESREAEAMVSAIISMSQTLKMTTVAEGIEEAEQADLLGLMDCQWGQGYYFAHPLDADQVEAFIVDRRASGACNSSNLFSDIHSTDGLQVFP